MSNTTDFNVGNQSFPNFRTELNEILAQLANVSAGSSAPTTTVAYMLWYDTTNDILKMRNSGDDAWISLMTLDQTNDAVQVFHFEDWTITQDSSGNLMFATGGTDRMKLDSSGNLSVEGDVTAFASL